MMSYCSRAVLSVTFSALIATQAQAARWIVRNPVVSQLKSLAADAEVKKDLQFGKNHYIAIELKRSTDKSMLAQEASYLQQALSSETVTPDFPIEVVKFHGVSPKYQHSFDVPSDAAWHVSKMQYSKLPANAAGQGVTVAVLDTGLDIEHAALKEHINDESYSVFKNSGDVTDAQGHGTHCAGIVGSDAKTNDASSAQGVAPMATIFSVQIIGGAGQGFLSDAAAGVKYAVDHGANVLSNSWRVYKSWGKYQPKPENLKLLDEAISYAESNDVIFVAAAGNESISTDNPSSLTNFDPIYPVGFDSHPLMLGVAASDQNAKPATFTNFGVKHVQVAAPGVDILSTVPGADRWQSMSGTSMATPLVAGVIARGLSAGLTPKEAIKRLVATSIKSDDWKNKVQSGGVINIVEYLNIAQNR